MSIFKNNFTIQNGIDIQTEQLNKWKALLKPKVYNQVQKLVTKNNDKATTGYDICRGDSITEIILNLR